MKISKHQFALLLPFAVLLALSLLLFAISPIWPEYELWRSGLLFLSLLVGIVLVLIYVSWVERIKEQDKDTKGEQ